MVPDTHLWQGNIRGFNDDCLLREDRLHANSASLNPARSAKEHVVKAEEMKVPGKQGQILVPAQAHGLSSPDKKILNGHAPTGWRANW